MTIIDTARGANECTTPIPAGKPNNNTKKATLKLHYDFRASGGAVDECPAWRGKCAHIHRERGTKTNSTGDQFV